MVMLIVGAMVETLVKHMTQKYLDNMDGVKIDGAPSWYMEPVKNKMCVFTHRRGGLGSIDIAKKNARYKMSKKIGDIIEIVIYDTKGNIKDKKEQAVVDKFKTDANLKVFIKRNINYSKVDYEDEIKTAFVRACIPTKTLLIYQEDRLMAINEAVLGAKSSSAFGSLDEEFGDDESGKKDKFDF
ncbi:MAG: hypothetical protein U9N59_02495 [Campylobacterota bacterium]|nr:hypothetical protein [Campylobacterota bacterium]